MAVCHMIDGGYWLGYQYYLDSQQCKSKRPKPGRMQIAHSFSVELQCYFGLYCVMQEKSRFMKIVKEKTFNR